MFFTKKRLLTLMAVCGLAYAVYAYAHTNTTTISRSKLDHPDLGYEGGSALHTAISSMWTKVGNNSNSRYFRAFGTADSVTITHEHNLGVPFADLDVLLYEGSPETDLTRVFDPTAAGYTIIATVGFEKLKIDVTTPSSGGPHDYSLVVVHGGSAGGAGGSGSGEINYVDNSGAEDASTAGWVLYNDGSVAAPVDGTGGSANVTFARTTSGGEVIRDLASFKLTKDAVDRQGEGVSYDFSISDADKNKLLKVEAEYRTIGTCADGDFGVFVYDVTAASLVSVSSNLLKAASGSSKALVSWPTSANSDYRVIFHVASTSASACALALDTVIVGPGKLTIQPVVTDWQSYPLPAVPGEFTASSTDAEWKRDGDSIEVQLLIVLSSVVSGTVVFDEADTLPPGLSCDQSKMTATVPFGQWRALDASAASTANDFSGNAAYIASISGWVLDTNAEDTVDASVPFTWASSDGLRVTLRCPVTQWSSTSLVFQPTANDMALTGWKSYTLPAPPGEFTSSATGAYWQRNADNIEMQISFTLSSVVSGSIIFDQADTLPTLSTAITCDHSKMTSSAVFGQWKATDVSAASTADDFTNNASYVKAVSGWALYTESADAVDSASPFTWASGDSLFVTLRCPITQWANLGSVPPIGVEVAGTNILGLAGPTGNTTDPASESCVTNCDACDVTRSKWAVVGPIVLWAFTISIDPTAASTNTECDFPVPVPAGDFTTEQNMQMSCNRTLATSGVQGNGVVVADTATESATFRTQNPSHSNASNYACTGMYMIQ